MKRSLVAVLVLAVAYYAVVIGTRGVALLGDHRVVFKGLGAGLLLLVGVGAALVVAEVRFGLAAHRLGRAANVAEAGDFDAAKAAVEAAPDDWRAWYGLALAYQAGRDPRRGRAAMRRAIALERASPASAALPRRSP